MTTLHRRSRCHPRGRPGRPGDREPQKLPRGPPYGLGGTLTTAPDALREMLNLATGRLRLSGGKETEFLRADTSDWTRTGRLSIIGEGDAPF